MKPEIEQAAADWLARRYAGFTPAEAAEFERWLAADSRHAAAFAELDEAWTLLDRLRIAGDRTASDPDALAPRRRRFAAWRAPALAAAAAVAILTFGWSPGRVPGWFQPSGPVERPATDVTTAVGETRKFDLPDGSWGRLNTDSRLEVVYSTAERRVRLIRGEAHFTVARNPARPFFVEAGGVAVRAIGTAFNVRLRADAIEVLVTEGKVQVADTAGRASLIASPVATDPGAAAPLLGAGERVVVPAGRVGPEGRRPVAVAAVAPAEMDRALAWQDKRLEFVAAPLAEIVAEFNRYNRRKISVDDPRLAARRFGGSFRADDPETFVRLLATRFGLGVERRGEATVLRAAR